MSERKSLSELVTPEVLAVFYFDVDQNGIEELEAFVEDAFTYVLKNEGYVSEDTSLVEAVEHRLAELHEVSPAKASAWLMVFVGVADVLIAQLVARAMCSLMKFPDVGPEERRGFAQETVSILDTVEAFYNQPTIPFLMESSPNIKDKQQFRAAIPMVRDNLQQNLV